MGYIDGIHGAPYITIYGSTMDPMGYSSLLVYYNKLQYPYLSNNKPIVYHFTTLIIRYSDTARTISATVPLQVVMLGAERSRCGSSGPKPWQFWPWLVAVGYNLI